MSDADLIRAAREEAEAIVAEAEEQARRILELAEQRKNLTAQDAQAIRETGKELARNLERSIDLLNKILQELKRQIG